MKTTYHRVWTYCMFTLGSLCLLYYLYLTLTYGFNYIVFSWIFLCVGGVMLFIGIWEQRHKTHLLSLLSNRLRRVVLFLMSIAIVLFLSLEACILYQGIHRDTNQGEAALILGAQLNGSHISRLLRYRLESGVEYAKTYPDAYLIVSGGQGAQESRSEAAAMKDYLIAHGVAKQRILTEDASINTQQNLTFSKKLMEQHNISSVSIITNDFHMFRARYIADQVGVKNYGYPARSDLDLAPNFYLREFFGSVKDIVQSWRS